LPATFGVPRKGSSFSKHCRSPRTVLPWTVLGPGPRFLNTLEVSADLIVLDPKRAEGGRDHCSGAGLGERERDEISHAELAVSRRELPEPSA